MVDDCPMTAECPGYDRNRRMCLLAPGDCELARAESEAVRSLEALDAPTVDAAAAARLPQA